MIFIYNETNINWKAVPISDKVVALKRVNTRNIGTKVIETRNSIILSRKLITKDFVDRLVKKGSNNTEAVNISDIRPALYFSYKKMEPFISNFNTEDNEKPNKHLALITLNIGDRKILEINSENTFILNSALANRELSLVVYLNHNHNLSIKLANRMGIKETVSFRVMNNRLVKTIERTETKDRVEDIKKFRIKNFTPKMPTYKVLAYKGYVEKVEKVLLEKKSNHTLTLYTMDTIQDRIKELKNEKYTAITLYIDSEEFNERFKKLNSKVLYNLNKNFDIINILLSNGKVIKYKK